MGVVGMGGASVVVGLAVAVGGLVFVAVGSCGTVEVGEG